MTFISFPSTLSSGFAVESRCQQSVPALRDLADFSFAVCGAAWNDGKIRAFVPATGEPTYEINNAHNLGVTAIAATSDCKQIISGGGDGQNFVTRVELLRICRLSALGRYVRKQMILDNTLFKCVCYHPGEYQIITSGTDRKVSKAAGTLQCTTHGLALVLG
ncbi:hypothetical protein Q9233_014032 [Columba guinea]|nr:hypothetical protein Q9233_014032 [Columba guinea]